MLLMLHRAGYVTAGAGAAGRATSANRRGRREKPKRPPVLEWNWRFAEKRRPAGAAAVPAGAGPADGELAKLVLFRGINPLYAVFLINQLGIADRNERIQAMESVLELPRSVGRFVRVPKQDELPPGPLATLRLDAAVAATRPGDAGRIGRAAAERKTSAAARTLDDEDRVWVLTLADKLRRLFDYEFPGVHDLRTQPVWAAGELLQFGGDFNKYVSSKDLQKQEGIVFRHVLRLILLVGEFKQLSPPEVDAAVVAGRVGGHCRTADGELPRRRPGQHRSDVGASQRRAAGSRNGGDGGGGIDAFRAGVASGVSGRSYSTIVRAISAHSWRTRRISARRAKKASNTCESKCPPRPSSIMRKHSSRGNAGL